MSIIDGYELDALHEIRERAAVLAVFFQKSPGEDSYAFTGSMNLVEDLREALAYYTLKYEKEEG